jgi:hypothetical protein
VGLGNALESTNGCVVQLRHLGDSASTCHWQWRGIAFGAISFTDYCLTMEAESVDSSIGRWVIALRHHIDASVEQRLL